MEVFKTIFNMSITGSIVFFMSLLIRPLTKKNFNSSWHYRMLILILIFFIVPVSSFINFPIKPMLNVSSIETQEPKDLENIIGNENIVDTGKNENTDIRKYEDEIKNEKRTVTETENYSLNKISFNIDTYPNIILYVWIGGMIILFSLKIVTYIRFKTTISANSLVLEDEGVLELFNQCKEELKINSEIYLKVCQDIGSPMLVGLLNPIVWIPSLDEDRKTLRMIFLHELNHYKRKDILIKYFGFIVNLIHWFNPMVYILLSKMNIDCEYSIDEIVVDQMMIEDRKYYGQIILKLMDNSIVRKNTFTTAMGSKGKELKSRLENMLFFKKDSRKRYILSLLVLVSFLGSGLLIACNIIPIKDIGDNDSFTVYVKEDGLYFSYLNNGKETKIHEGKEFSYPLISKSGNYIAYTKGDSLYIYNIKNKQYEKIADHIEHYYVSYDWVDDENIVYSMDKPGFVIYNVSTKERKEHLDEYYYDNFKASKGDIVYSRKMSKWSTEEGDFASNNGIVEISLNKYDFKNKIFTTNIIIEVPKSTDETIGYNPIIWNITDDGKYIYIMEKPASGSLSTDGIGIGIYDVKKKAHTEFTDITTLHYKNHLAINPKNNNLIGLIEGGAREMILNKEVILLNINEDNTYEAIRFMDKDLVAMTPSFTIDGKKLLYSATNGVNAFIGFDYNKAFEDWEVQPHNIYEYDLETLKTKKITEGNYFDFLPISISKDEILFSRYKGDGYHDLVKISNGKEEIIVEDIIIDYEYKGGNFGFYGHLETEKGIDIYLSKKENFYSEFEFKKPDVSGKTNLSEFEKEPKDMVDKNYERISEYMKEHSIAAFSPYYELLDFQISDYVEKSTDEGTEATFYYKIIEKNYDKDPDTVGYIKEAKESGSQNYQQMYDEYLEPREMNFNFKVVIDKEDKITLYSNVSPNGVQWEETEMTDYILQ